MNPNPSPSPSTFPHFLLSDSTLRSHVTQTFAEQIKPFEPDGDRETGGAGPCARRFGGR